MNKDRFKELLEDLYTIYNPAHLQYLQFLTDKYFQMPSEAIEMTFTKYNSPNVSHHDPNKNTEEYRNMLISEYGKGNRILKNADIIGDAQKNQELFESEKKRQAEEDEKIRLEKELQREAELKKEKDRLQKELEEIKKLKKDISEHEPKVIEITKEPELEIDVQTNVEGKLNLPNAMILSSMGVGSRFVTTTEDGKIVGLVVKDILLDNTTVEFMGKPSLMIVMEKA